MAGLRGVILVLHVLSVIYWLGADVVVFILGFSARDRTAPVVVRQERVRIMGVVDRLVIQSSKVTYATGVLLLLLSGLHFPGPGWFQVKLVLVGLILLTTLLLTRVATIGSLRGAVAALAAGDPRAAALDEAAWRYRWRSRSLVLTIYGLLIVIISLSLLKPF